MYKENIEPEIDSLRKFDLTLDAKSVLSKSKILPKVSYNSGFHEIPLVIRRKIETKMSKFSLGNKGTLNQYEEICRGKDHGGYDICQVVKHSELALLKPIIKLIRCKMNIIPLTVDVALTESEVGLRIHAINSELNLRQLTNIQHQAEMSQPYKTSLEIIRYYKISGDELMRGKLSAIYARIQNGTTRTQYPGVNNTSFQKVPPIFSSIHHNILPNYLKTFIYRMSNSILPLKCNFSSFGLDTDSRCEFCNLHYETNYHVFKECTFVKKLWENIEYKTGLQLLNSNIINFKHCDKDRNYNMNVYCTAVICHKIWKIRNEMRHEGRLNFDEEFIINSFQKSIFSRHNFEQRRTDSVFLSDFTRILTRVNMC